MSLDFHPNKEDLLCSCDNNSEIRYWSINNGSCAGVFKVASLMLIILKGNYISIYNHSFLLHRIFNNLFQFQSGATKMRFQPRLGRILAAAVDNFISILDVETQVCRLKLQVSYS